MHLHKIIFSLFVIQKIVKEFNSKFLGNDFYT